MKVMSPLPVILAALLIFGEVCNLDEGCGCQALPRKKEFFDKFLGKTVSNVDDIHHQTADQLTSQSKNSTGTLLEDLEAVNSNGDVSFHTKLLIVNDIGTVTDNQGCINAVNVNAPDIKEAIKRVANKIVDFFTGRNIDTVTVNKGCINELNLNFGSAAKKPKPVQKRPKPVQKRPKPIQKRPKPVQKRPKPVRRRPTSDRRDRFEDYQQEKVLEGLLET
jgi:hypothetical protein